MKAIRSEHNRTYRYKVSVIDILLLLLGFYVRCDYHTFGLWASPVNPLRGGLHRHAVQTWVYRLKGGK